MQSLEIVSNGYQIPLGRLIVTVMVHTCTCLGPFSRDTSGKGCLTSPSCGAKYPGYLMKTHPNHLGPGENVIDTLCFSNGKTCCAKTQKIEIMKCKDFFIYKLPAACIKRGRYCGNGGKIRDRKALAEQTLSP